MRTLAGIVALTAVFTLAICFILIGAISEEIKARLGIDNSAVGSLAMALFLTSLAVQLFVGILVDKLGHKIMAIVGFVATSGAVFLLAAATTWHSSHGLQPAGSRSHVREHGGQHAAADRAL